MKKLLPLLLSLALVVSLAACGGTPSADPTAAPTKVPDEPAPTTEATQEPTPKPQKEEEAYEITYSSARAYQNSIGTTYAQVIVEIENTGSADLYLSSGSYDLEDAEGNLVASSSLVSTYPEVISPGEKAYMYEENMLDEEVEGELTVLPRPDVKKAKVENIRYQVTDVEIVPDTFSGVKAKGRVENTTDQDADGMVYVVLILKNSEGAPIGELFTILTDDLAAGDKIGFEATSLMLPDDVTADQVAGFDAFAYPMQMQF